MKFRPLHLALAALVLFSTLGILRSAEVLQEVTVKDGDTLWGIANYYLKDPKKWPEILKHNNLPLTDPAAALPGMKLKIPVLLIKEELRKAILVYLLNDVRFRKKDKAEWNQAAKDVELYNEDSLRTMEKSRAHVNFYSGELLKLDENSLAVLRPELKVEEVNLLAGAVRAGSVKLITPTAQVTPKGRGTVYKARIRPDKALIVQVEKGNAEVFRVETGITVNGPAGQANITIPKKAPTRPMKVAPMPDFDVAEFSAAGEILPGKIYMKEPPEDRQADLKVEPVKGKTAKDAPPEAELKPGKEPKAEEVKSPEKKPKVEIKVKKGYRLQLSLDPKFSTIFAEQKGEMADGDPLAEDQEYELPDGKYYRRISYFDPAGNEGDFVDLYPLELDNEPPKLVIFAPKEGFKTQKGFVNVEGQTEVGCFVTVNDYQVPIRSDGKFLWSVVLASEGSFKIRVMTKDKKGNVTRMGRTVHKEAETGINLDEEK